MRKFSSIVEDGLFDQLVPYIRDEIPYDDIKSMFCKASYAIERFCKDNDIEFTYQDSHDLLSNLDIRPNPL